MDCVEVWTILLGGKNIFLIYITYNQKKIKNFRRQGKKKIQRSELNKLQHFRRGKAES